MTTERDIRNQIKFAHDTGKTEGFAEGKAEGHAAGKAEGKLEIAQAMLARGLGAEMIAELTGLSLEEIESLR